MLTDAGIKALKATGERRVLSDGKVEGLQLRVGADAVSKTWSLLYYARDANGNATGERRRVNLGRFPAMGVKAARKEASDRLTAIRRGHDPAAEKQRAKATPTLAEAIDRYLAAIVVAKRTLATYKQRLEKYVVPALGRRPVNAVGAADVRHLHAKLTKAGTAVAANRTVESLRAFYTWAAVEWPDIVTSNPARFPTMGVRRNPEGKRDRIITAAERKALLDAIAAGEAMAAKREGSLNPTYANAFRLILMTGMRPIDVVTLRHENITRRVSKGRKVWIAVWRAQGDGRTKKANQRRVLNSAAIEIIEAQAKITGGDGWVFPNAAGKQTTSNQLSRTFRALRTAAKLPADVSLYVAGRHTYVSEAVMAGIPLEVVGADVDNASAVQRYAHLRRAVEEGGGVSEHVLAALRGGK